MIVLHRRRPLAKSCLKGTAEMRRIFKAAFKGGFTNRFIPIAHQVQRMLQSFLKQPSAGRAVKNLFKIPFKSRQAPVAQLSIHFEFQVITKIVLHNPLKQYLLRLVQQRAEIGQQLCIGGIIRDVQHKLFEFDLQQRSDRGPVFLKNRRTSKERNPSGFHSIPAK
jgi:hypothetical protein